MPAGILHAMLAAALFGASTPLAKLLVGQMAPTLLVPAVVSIDAKRSDSALPKVETDETPAPSKRQVMRCWRRTR